MRNIINIGVFGRRNVGKSSVVNAILGQNIAIVSEVPGTTTDPVRQRFEFPGIGPAVLIDTAGIDDYGELGEKRKERSLDTIARIDVALIILANDVFTGEEQALKQELERYSVPIVTIRNKTDLKTMDREEKERIKAQWGTEPIPFSAAFPTEEMKDIVINKLKDSVGSSAYAEQEMFCGLVTKGDHILLVCPVDSEAPAGRLILPQAMAIRNILDYGASVTVTIPENTASFFHENKYSFKLAVTDSQAFSEVAQAVPENVPLTSFSMLLARSKGCFEQYIKGVSKLGNMHDGDKVLILESCTHHTTCEDIGRVKIPAMLRKFSGKKLEFDIISGLSSIDRPMEDYSIVIQCGGCMISKRQLFSRLLPAIEKGVPVVNYGMAISYMKGIYGRAIKPLMK